MTQEIVLGLVIAGLAGTAAVITSPHTAILSWFVTLSGLWTLIAPFVVGYSQHMTISTINDACVGFVVLVLGLANTVTYGPPTVSA